MELKVSKIRYCGRCHLFQSHLYGIERIILQILLTLLHSFNRTFMELKAHDLRPSQVSQSVFQSHLYGIERGK